MTLRNAVAHALELGAQQGTWVSAREALAPLDPVRRWVARRRLAKVLAETRRRVTSDEPAVQLRAAALLALDPSTAVSLDDAAAVDAELARRGPRSIVKERPYVTLGIAAAVLAAGAGAYGGMRWFAPFDPSASAAGEALGRGLTAFQRTAGFSRQRAVEGGAPLSDGAATRAFGAEGATRFARVLDAAERLARAPEPTAERDVFLGASDGFSAFLGDQKLPYYVDAEVIGAGNGLRPLLMSSYVERQVELEAGGHRLRAFHLWALDSRALRIGVLGYTRPRTPAALVQLDQVEEDLVRWVLPALPTGESMELVDERTALSPDEWVTAVELAAAATLRRHYAKLSEDVQVLRVGQLLARRRSLVKKWKASLSGQGMNLIVPERLVPERDYAKDLEIRITRENLREWDELHAELLEPRVLAAFGRLRDRYTLSIERHEAQHRLDFSRGFTPLPEIVARLTGEEDRLAVREGSLAAATRNELSAYLAELGEALDSPLLPLVLMSRLALSRDTLATPHALAAVSALIAVGAELGLGTDELLGRTIRRRDIADLLTRVGAQDPDRVRKAATAAYAKCFGEPLPHVRRLRVVDNPAWRH
jgi:hypothetical protein